jgi:membrane fusion protein
VAIVALLFCGSYTRQVRVSGALLPRAGLIRVTAPQSGVVAERFFSEGQPVRAGQPLIRLLGDRYSTRGDSVGTAAATLLAAQRASLAIEADRQQQQGQWRARVLQDQLARLTAEVQRANEQLTLQERRVALARQSLERYQALQQRGFVAVVQLQDREAELIDQQRLQAELQRGLLALQAQRASTVAELRVLRLEQQREAAAAQRALADMDQQLADNDARREQTVTAPRSGVVGTLIAQHGESLATGALIATLLPVDGTLEAVLLAPSQAAASARVGMTVWLRYHGWPYRKYGQYRGRIREIAPAALAGDELARSSGLSVTSRGAEALYRVRVALDRQYVLANGQRVPLSAGMSLEASIAADRRRLYEWLFEPLYLARGRA